MKPIPEELLHRPFSRAQARKLGVTDRMLNGSRFVRVHPRVFRHRDHEMTAADRIEAARLALPAHARLTGITRIQELGLDYGPTRPLRFVVEGKLHLALEGIFLHRTKRMPRLDNDAVSGAAAFVAYCARARVIDAIKVGDWLIEQGHMTVDGLRDVALAEPWRPGATEAVWVLSHLRTGSRSLKESETRAVLEFAGLPTPEINAVIPLAEDLTLIGDLLYRRWLTVVEYEGAQHQHDRDQYVSDIDRYAVLRRHGVGYVQVTRELLRRPQTLVGEVYRELVSHGYDGPPPTFGEHWRSLFMPIRQLLAHDRALARLSGGSRTVS